jgi:hypothetical protein
MTFGPVSLMTIVRDKQWWTEWIHEDVGRVHYCAENKHDDVGVLWHEDPEEKSFHWFLAITWTATDDDVTRGDAPATGEILSATELRVARSVHSVAPDCRLRVTPSSTLLWAPTAL